MKAFFKKLFSILKKNLTIIIILFIFLFLYICDNSSLKVGNVIMDNLKSIATSFTPTTDLFDDGSEVSFVSYFFGMKVEAKEEKLDFYLPVNSTNLSNIGEYFSYAYTGVVNSVAKGEVQSVGYTKDGLKYIEIKHPNGYVSTYVGLQTVGVMAGEKISQNKPIGMSQSNQNLKVYVHLKDNVVSVSEIEWKK